MLLHPYNRNICWPIHTTPTRIFNISNEHDRKGASKKHDRENKTACGEAIGEWGSAWSINRECEIFGERNEQTDIDTENETEDDGRGSYADDEELEIEVSKVYERCMVQLGEGLKTVG